MLDYAPDCPMHRETFREDERAIEGLPIRLVIAVAVGVAAMGIMLGMLEGIEDVGETEVTVGLSEELVVAEEATVSLSVQTVDGQPIDDATVIVSGDTVPVANGPVVLDTGPDSHEAELTISEESGETDHAHIAFRDGQARGTVSLEVVPPSGGDLVDERANPDLVVIRG